MPRRVPTLQPIVDDIADNAAAFSRHLEAEGKSAATIDVYTKATAQLATFLAAQGMPLRVANITREHIESFLIDLRSTPRYNPRNKSTRVMQPATINQRFRSLQQFWKYLEAEGLLTANPLRNIARPSIPDNPPPVITLPQMQALLATCAGTSFADRRDTAILSLFYDTGIRRAEMSGISLDDLDLGARTVTVTGKGSRRRTVRYGADMARTLDRYLRERAKSDYHDAPALWLGERGPLGPHGIEQVVKRRAMAASLAFHPHSFRHAATHHLLASGYSEGDVMQQMGWKSRQMADRYGRSVAGERARANFDPHSPLSKLRRGSPG